MNEECRGNGMLKVGGGEVVGDRSRRGEKVVTQLGVPLPPRPLSLQLHVYQHLQEMGSTAERVLENLQPLVRELETTHSS